MTDADRPVTPATQPVAVAVAVAVSSVMGGLVRQPGQSIERFRPIRIFELVAIALGELGESVGIVRIDVLESDRQLYEP